MNTNWDHLRYFNALAGQGTLSAAARQLGVSHSTVQRHIAAFEEELQVQLFISAANGYKLTAAGETLRRETEAIQRTLTSLSSRLTGSDDNLQGNVSVTVSDTVSHFLLPDMISDLKRRYPQISFSISVLNKLSNIRDLEADIAVRTGNKPPTDVIGREVGTVTFAVCASKAYLSNHKLNPANALREAKDIIALDESFNDSAFNHWLPAKSAEQNIVRVNGFLVAWRLCNAGLGVSMLPAYLLRQDNALVEIASPAVPLPANKLWVLSHAALRDSNRVKVVRQYLTEKLQMIFVDTPD